MRRLLLTSATALSALTAGVFIAAAATAAPQDAPPPPAPIFYCPLPATATPIAPLAPAHGAPAKAGKPAVRPAAAPPCPPPRARLQRARHPVLMHRGFHMRTAEITRPYNEEDDGVARSQARVYRYELSHHGLYPWQVEPYPHRRPRWTEDSTPLPSDLIRRHGEHDYAWQDEAPPPPPAPPVRPAPPPPAPPVLADADDGHHHHHHDHDRDHDGAHGDDYAYGQQAQGAVRYEERHVERSYQDASRRQAQDALAYDDHAAYRDDHRQARQAYAEQSYGQQSYGQQSYDQGGYDQGAYDQGAYDQGAYEEGAHDQGSQDRGSQDRDAHDRGGYDDRYADNRGDDDRRQAEQHSSSYQHSQYDNGGGSVQGEHDGQVYYHSWGDAGAAPDRAAGQAGDYRQGWSDRYSHSDVDAQGYAHHSGGGYAYSEEGGDTGWQGGPAPDDRRAYPGGGNGGGYDHADAQQQGYAGAGYAGQGYAQQQDYGQNDYDQSGYGQSGYDQSGYGEGVYGQSGQGYDQNGYYGQGPYNPGNGQPAWRTNTGGGYEVYSAAGRDGDGYLTWAGKPRAPGS